VAKLTRTITLTNGDLDFIEEMVEFLQDILDATVDDNETESDCAPN
jgi:hypothetical protein